MRFDEPYLGRKRLLERQFVYSLSSTEKSILAAIAGCESGNGI